MDSSKIKSLVQEIEGMLRTMRSSILISRQEGIAADLYHHVESARTFRDRASEMSLWRLETVLSTIVQEASRSFVPGVMPSDAACRSVLDLIAHAEAEAIKLHVEADEQSIDLAQFVDNSFDILQLDSLLEPPIPPEPSFFEEQESRAVTALETPEENAEDEFEPDEEMLEIFAMEAEDLLGNIETNLDTLVAAPENRDALWEVRRHAHTFKGAAGIIGLKKPSKLAHRIEDLLDYLSQNEIVPNAKILELIGSATNCLRAITKGDSSPGMSALTNEVYQAFDTVMHDLTNPPVEEVVVAVEPEPEPLVQPIMVSTPVVEKTAETVENTQPAQRPIVRVSIARLDELVRIARDLVVSRSIVEQRIAEFDTHLETLARTTRRLQAATARIENDFEASMLDAPAPVSFNPPRSALRNDIPVYDQAPEFDSLELDRYTDFHESSRDLSEATQDCFAITTALESLKGTLDAVFEDQRRLIEETQEKVMQIRLIRFGSIATRIQRAVRVTCEEENKRADVVIENQDVEIDTDLLDSLVEPLMHLIRNAVVHGIESPDTRRLVGKPETGRLIVRMTNEETHIEVRVADDGRGISANYLRERAIDAGLLDPKDAGQLGADELLTLMCMPGLTTAEKLTMSAGRGVGMSIVKESVETRNGTISVETMPQRGTTFTVRIPLAFAVAQALLVKSDNHSAAIPLKVVKQIVELNPMEIRTSDGKPFADINAINFPVRRLSDFFPARHRREAPVDSLNTLLVETGKEKFALIVDEIVRTEEIAIKPLGKPLDSLPLVLGAAVLGNGEVVPVIDASQIARAEMVQEFDAEPIPEPEAKPRVLVVDDSPSVRHMTSKVIVAAGWEAMTAKDGVEAMEVLRGEILPDVVLTDVEMPRMDGYELISTVQKDETLRHIPMVFITSRASEKHRERAMELGITEYLTKPFVEAELISLVERLSTPQPVI